MKRSLIVVPICLIAGVILLYVGFGGLLDHPAPSWLKWVGLLLAVIAILTTRKCMQVVKRSGAD
jgi:protein-S-isoprenylcysteine O-methyltransferase Ste14